MTKFLTTILLLSLYTSCTTFGRQDYGLNTDRSAYVPARISVLSCSSFPIQDEKLIKFSKVQISKDKLDSLCDRFDLFIISSFTNQPFMKGYTPKAVQNLIAKSTTPDLLTNFNKNWSMDGSICEECDNIINFYKSEMFSKTTWLQWLNQLSQATKFSDTILVPFIISANQDTIDDRGLLISRNSAQIVLLLIDTNNGELIWSGQRSAEIDEKTLRTQGTDFPPFPLWETIDSRLFTESLWDKFPGRQTI